MQGATHEIHLQKEEVKMRIETLRLELEKHRVLYHVHDTPEISDELYDSLMGELSFLEKANPEFRSKDSPTQRIGGDVLTEFVKVKHEYPQWSFDNVFSLQELSEWEERNRKMLQKSGIDTVPSYVAEMKIDGLKVVLTYEKGLLIRAATRGDGKVGEDVTENIKTIRSIPLVLSEPLTLTVIGEAWIEKKELVKLNKERELTGEAPYANTRNLAAGTLRQLDPKIVAKRNLKLFAYDVEGSLKETQEEELSLLESLGFLVNKNRRLCKCLDEVQAFYDSWKEKKEGEEYGIDGLVVKTNERDLWDALGYKAKSPRAGIAYKFPAEEVSAVIETIIYQVGRTGVVTPVAELTPTLLAGSLVKRATLHNKDEMERLGVHEGDTVGLRKAGDVIPEIFTVFTALRNKDARVFIFPTRCPECHTALEKEKIGKEYSVGLYCKNKDCPAKHIENLIHFVSKKAMNIEGLGEKIIETLFDLGLITDYASLFELKKEDIENLEGFGEKSADNFLKEREKASHVELARLLFALGIRHLGEETAKELSKRVKTIEGVLHLSYDDLVAIPSIGDKVALSLVEYRSDERAFFQLRRLLPFLTLTNSLFGNEGGGKLAGLTFVITGTFENFSREEAKALLEKEGGKVSSSVSKKTDYLIAGEAAGSKLADAESLDVPIVGEEYLTSLRVDFF